MDPVKHLFEERRRAANELRALYDNVSADQELDADAKVKEERLQSFLSEADERLTALLDERAREASIVEAMDTFPANTEGRQAPDTTDESELLRTLKIGEGRDFHPSVENRTMVTSAAAQSVNIATLYEQLVEHLIENSTVMQAQATVLRTAGGEPVRYPKTSTYSTAAIVDEDAALSASEPTFSSVSLGAYKYGFLVGISSELLDDNYVNLASFLARQGGVALGNGIGAHLVTGTGAGQPNGVDNCTTGLTAASGTAIGFDDLIDLQHSVVTGYRSNAVWLMKDSTLKALRKVKDSNGQYIWQPAVTAGAPDNILGRPVYTDPNMDAIGVSNYPVVFGDFRGYVVRFAGPLRVERSVDFRFSQDQVVYRFIQRADGDIVDTEALRKLRMAAS